MSLQYALDFDEYQLYQTRIATFLALIPAEGPVTLSGAYNRNNPLAEEYVGCWDLTTFDGGLDYSDRAQNFAKEIQRRFGNQARIAVERPEVVLSAHWTRPDWMWWTPVRLSINPFRQIGG